jgi:putative lipoprotein
MTVSVLDVMIADAPAKTIAVKRYKVTNVPRAFSLRIPRKALWHEMAVSLQVKINDKSGRLLWITDTRNPVVAKPGSAQIDLGEIVLVQAIG